MNPKLIAKEDFLQYVPFSENIGEEKLYPHIDDAERFDFQPLFPTVLVNAIRLELEQPIAAWSRIKVYAIGDVVQHKDVYYRAVAAGSIPEPESGNALWQLAELLNFYAAYVKPYLVCCACARFLLWHGRNVTQYGLRNNLDDTSETLTDKARAELINDMESKAGHFLTRLTLAYTTPKGTFDGVAYGSIGCAVTSKSNFKIIQI